MLVPLDPPLVPRNGTTLEVILPGRVSSPGPGKQNKKQSLGDQEDIQRRWLERHTDLPLEITVVAGSGSGELLERDEYHQLLHLIVSEKYDLVLTEDLGRIARRVSAYNVCELCEDHGVRLISINNHHVDTAKPGWRDAAFFASYFYEKDNQDKSARLKERLRSRFLTGGAIPGLIYGYIKPAGAKSDEDLIKDPDAEPIYKEWFRTLDDGATYAEIADWLNSKNIPVGPSCRGKDKWDGPLVAKTTHNPLLKGVRFRNKRKTRRINQSGRYKSELAPPQELLKRCVPHLAFFEPAYYERVVSKADEKNVIYRRAGRDGDDPLRNRPRKRTRYPGQSVHCGVCGNLYVFGGHGQKEHLMCAGAREHKCWNGVTFDGPDACAWLTSVIYSEIEAFPAFEPEFLAMLESEVSQLDSRLAQQLRTLEGDEQRNSRDLKNILAAIRQRSDSQILLADLDRLEREKAEIAYRRNEIESMKAAPIELPSVDAIKNVAREEFARLSRESHEFACFMRQLIPEIYVFPFRLCDGGSIVLRASLCFSATPLVPRGTSGLDGLAQRLDRVLTVNLFDAPQREHFRERVMQMRLAGCTEKDAAAALGITITAAQRAAALQRRMVELGTADPWLPVTSPPDDCGKLRRHLHPRYSFQPKAGFPREWPK